MLRCEVGSGCQAVTKPARSDDDMSCGLAANCHRVLRIGMTHCLSAPSKWHHPCSSRCRSAPGFGPCKPKEKEYEIWKWTPLGVLHRWLVGCRLYQGPTGQARWRQAGCCFVVSSS